VQRCEILIRRLLIALKIQNSNNILHYKYYDFADDMLLYILCFYFFYFFFLCFFIYIFLFYFLYFSGPASKMHLSKKLSRQRKKSASFTFLLACGLQIDLALYGENSLSARRQTQSTPSVLSMTADYERPSPTTTTSTTTDKPPGEPARMNGNGNAHPHRQMESQTNATQQYFNSNQTFDAIRL